jgi:hypothetical protein
MIFTNFVNTDPKFANFVSRALNSRPLIVDIHGGLMSSWVSELSSLMKAWIGASPDRNASVLHRTVAQSQDISYGTIKHAMKGDHEINFAMAIAILKVVVPTKEGRRSFIKRHHPEYLEFSKEILEDDDLEAKGLAPQLSHHEAIYVGKLIKRCVLGISELKSSLGENLYENFLAWLEFYKIGKEKGECVVLTGPWIEFPDLIAAGKIIASSIDQMNPSKHDGDLLQLALGMTSREAARRCWYIQLEAWRQCLEIIKQNPGDDEIMTGNIMKYK